ncbi:methionine ABC transporter permease [Streptococcus sp. H49]|uniref:methionine ABC transporter permease n=1 Tax=Streptococcus huangxiaojuni TaxID=3237239 RepID=UPI0034A4CB2E
MADLIQTYLPNVYDMGWTGDAGWWTAIVNTLFMTFVSFAIGGFLGLIGGLFLVLTAPGGVIENAFVFQVLDKVVSVFRAIPFIILLAVLSPLTYMIVGTNLGATAALVPLSAATFPFFARQVQVVLSELDRGVIEAAQASGATFWDIVSIYLSEGLPDIIRVMTVTLISLVSETAMAGAIGAGGLGYVAIYYGYNRYNQDIVWLATILIVILIFALQFLGDFVTRKLGRK